MTYDFSMLTVIETPMFLRYAAKVWDDSERDEFIAWLAEYPDAGDVMVATGGLRKVRWSRLHAAQCPRGVGVVDRIRQGRTRCTIECVFAQLGTTL